MMKILVITEPSEDGFNLIATKKLIEKHRVGTVCRELDLSDEGIKEMALEKYPVKNMNFQSGKPFDVNLIYRNTFIESLKHLREKL